MRKITKAMPPVLVLAAVALVGCGSDSKVSVPPRGDQSYLTFEQGTHPRFDPATSDLPFNTDLIFLTPAGAQGDAFDGTAHIDQPANPVINAVNSLDGFSTNAPFDVLIGGSLDAATVVGAGAPPTVPTANVFLIQLNTVEGGEPLSPEDIDLANPIAGMAPISAEVISLDGGVDNAIRITPLQPLESATKYLVFISSAFNPIMDAQGEPMTRSWTYNALSSPAFQPSGALANVKSLVSAWHALGSGFLQFASGGAIDTATGTDSIQLSYTFTTGAPMDVLVAMASPRAALVQAQIDMGIDEADAVNNLGLIQNFATLPTPAPRDVGVSELTAFDLGNFSDLLDDDVGTLYTGYIRLPYYLTAPESGADPTELAYADSFWAADRELGGVLSLALPPGAPPLPPVDVDGSTYNVTYRYPFAEQRGEESVPLQITLPDPAFAPVEPEFGGATCGQVAALQGGHPVVMYIHGITSERTAIAALAHSLAARCVATVSIDLPVHGAPATGALSALNVETSAVYPFGDIYGPDAPRERHFNHPGGSGAAFINLAELRSTRDNMRQSVMDMLNLNASLGNINDALDDAGLPLLNLDEVTVVGASLGGIVGSVYATVNQLALAREDGTVFTSSLRPINGLVASVAGSQLTQVLLNSDTFGPVIRAGLQGAGVVEGTTNFARFIYAAQSTVDTGDPVGFAGVLGQLGVPVLLQQVANDTVVPNDAAGLPLAGTAGLAALLDAEQLAPGADQPVDTAIVKMGRGGHGSLLDPSVDLGVTMEMQTQVVTFVLSGGAAVTVGGADPTAIETP